MQAESTAAPALPAPLPEGGAGGGFMNRNEHADHHATTSAQFIDFQPTQEGASDILCALTDPDQTLREIAHRFHTTLDALADWLDSPPVLQRVEKMKRVAASRDALILAAHFRAALAVLVSLIEAHQHDEQHIPVDPQNLKSVTQRDRRRAAARLAASQLIRLTRSGCRGRAGSSPLDHGGAPTPQTTPAAPHSTPSPAHPLTSSPHTSRPPTPDLTTHNIETPPSPTPKRDTQPPTGGQAASGTQSILRAPPHDPAFHSAALTRETG